MGLFRGMFYNNDPQNHVFVTNHPAMSYAGLRTFNLNLIKQFSQEPRLQNVVANAFRRTGRSIDKNLVLTGIDKESVFLERIADLLGMTLDIDPSFGDSFKFGCSAYDIEARSYDPNATFSTNEVIEMIKWYEETWLPSGQDKDDDDVYNEEYYRKINSIKNSIEKYAFMERNVESFNHITEQGFDKIYLRLYFADKAVLSSSRIVVPKGPPKFTDIPRRPTGKKYSHGKSAKQPIGVSIDLEDSDLNDPEDSVVADMRMSYNPAINKWEVQNQILARLLTDVDPAPIRSVPLDIVDVDAIPAEDFSDVGGDKYLGQFSTGLAMPLSSENGNPHTFGPNIIKCSDGSECEKIRVFNRANKTYTKGQLVICHFIGNEWIIQDFGADLEFEPRAVGVGTWQFAKFITSTNTHFREGNPEFDSDGDFKNLQIRPDEWSTILRDRFYKENDTTTLSQNGVSSAVTALTSNINLKAKLNTDIMQSTIWDQYNNGQQFNIINPEGKGLDPDWNEVCPMYWGPVFNGGFAKNVKAMGVEGSTEWKPYLGRNGAVNLPIDDLIHFAGYGSSLGSDRESIRSPHLPPEVAVNGPWGEDSSPVESYHNMARDINNNNYDFMVDGSHQYYSYYEDEDGNKSTFALKPNDPNVVTFIALAGEFAAADDLLAQSKIMPVNYRSQRAFYDKARSFSGVGNVGMGRALYRGNPEVGTYNRLQPVNLLDSAALQAEDDTIDSTNRANYTAWQRENALTCPNASAPFDQQKSPANPTTDPVTGEINDPCMPPTSAPSLSETITSVRTVPYDYYVKSKFDNSVFGPNDAYISSDGDDQGAECQGIITARTKLLRQGGGAVTFETLNTFGMVGTVTANVQNANISIIPLFPPIALGTGGSFSVNPRSRVWGNAEQGPENFGLTALHVQVFDYWPPEQTLYIAPYFTILHFNAGRFNSSPISEKKWFRPKPSDKSKINYVDPVAGTPTEQMIADEGLLSAEVEKLSYEGVDFRVPTRHKLRVLDDPIGETLSYKESIDADTELRPKEYWNVSTDARGLLLTNGGAVSTHLAIGVAFKEKEYDPQEIDYGELLPDRYDIVDEGEGFEVGQVVTSVSKGVMIEVTSINANGAISGFKFAKKNSEEFSQDNLGPGGYELGDDLEPSDFPLTLSFISGATGGVTARIKFTRGMIYRKVVYHRAPERYTPAFKGTRISESCGQGDQYVRGKIKSTSITLDDNSSYHPYPGEYEAFFYFHNDISHTFMAGNTLNSNPYLQYIKLTIS